MIAIVLVVAAAVVGLVGWFWWRGDGTVRTGSGEVLKAHEAALPDDAFGPAATLLLFGSQQDGRTDLVRRRLLALALEDRGVAVAEVDLTRRGDLAGRWAVTRTPSVFVLDADGRLRARVRGVAGPEALRAALDSALRPAR